MIEYGALVEELHLIVFTQSGFETKSGTKYIGLSHQLKNKWHYVRDAYRIGRTLEDIDLVTAQDPFEAWSSRGASREN